MPSRRSVGMGFMGLSGSAAEHPILAHNCAAWTTILTQGEGTRLPFRHPARRLKKLREQHQNVTRQEALAVTLTPLRQSAAF